MAAAPNRVQELFLRAIAEPDMAARSALVERECEPALRKRLGALLKAHDSTNAMVDRPAVGNSTLLFNGATGSRYRTAQPGDVLASRYRIVKQLGRGGMGVVFLAEQLDLHRHVALKMLTAGAFASPDELARFRGEAESLARLQHVGIVQVYDVGTHDGLPYLAMEYVAGGSLADSRRPFDPPDAARLVESLARAVQSAHGHGIVHRDLKPANVLLDETQSPKITDFGLAKLLDQQSGLTRTGVVAGTPGYMSPEQASGRGAIGPAADIFALGAILYDLLTGRPPFQGATPHETVLQTCSHEPPAPSTLRYGISHDLITICMKCLEKEPRRRYGSAGDLADDLGRFLRHEPIRARQVGNVERLVKWARRRPAVAALLAAIVAVTAAAFVAVFIAFINARSAQQNESQQRLAAERSVYFGNIAQSRSQWLLNNIHGSRSLLNQCAPELRSWEWHYLDGLHRGNLLTIADAAEPVVFNLDIDRNGNRIVVAGGNPYPGFTRGAVRVFDINGRAIWRHNFPMFPSEAKFTHDGRYVICCIGMYRRSGVGEIVVMDAQTGESVRQLEGPKNSTPYTLALNSNGDTLAVGFDNASVHFWNTSDWTKQSQQLTAGSPVVSLSFSGDDKWLVVGGDPTTELWERPEWKPRGKLPYAGYCTKFSSVGTLMAEVWNSNVRIRDLSQLNTGNLQDMPIKHSLGNSTMSIRNIAFSNDAKIIATASADGTVRTWNIERCVELNTFRGHTGHVTCVAFHPDGRSLVSAGQQPGDVKVWDFTKPQDNALHQFFPSFNHHTECIVFNESDDHILGFNRWGNLVSWDFKSDIKTDRGIFDKSQEWIVPGSIAAFSDDGRRLAAVPSKATNVVKVHDIADHKELCAITCKLKVWYIALDKTGNRVAVAAQDRTDGVVHRELRVWDVGQQRVIFEETATGEQPIALVFSADGNQVAYSIRRSAPVSDAATTSQPNDQEVKVIDLTKLTAKTAPALTAPVRAVALSNDGRKLAMVDTDGVGTICGIADQLIVEQRLSGPTGIYDLAFNPDSTRLAGVTRELVHVWDVRSGQDILTLRGAPQRPSDNGFNPRVIWNHDGTRLAVSNWDSSVSMWTGRPEKR